MFIFRESAKVVFRNDINIQGWAISGLSLVVPPELLFVAKIYISLYFHPEDNYSCSHATFKYLG